MIFLQVIVDRPRPRFNKKEVVTLLLSLKYFLMRFQPKYFQISRPFRKLSSGGRGPRVHKKINLDGSYNFRYSTGDGMSRQETGQPSDSGSGLVQSGSWSYTGADGKLYKMKFVADQFGYRPQGDHLHLAHQLAFKQQEMLARRARTRQARRHSRP